MHKDTQEEFDKRFVIPANWDSGYTGKIMQYTDSKDIKAFINSHFIDKRVIEEEMKEIDEAILQIKTKGEIHTEATRWATHGYKKGVKDLKQSLLDKSK